MDAAYPHFAGGIRICADRFRPDRNRTACGDSYRHNEGVIQKLAEQIEARFAELEQQMSDPAVIADRERYAEVGREYRQIGPANALVSEYRSLSGDLEGARELLEEGEDEELERVVREAPARLEEIEEEIRLAMVESDPNDEKNVIVELRAGTGGDEAALFRR